MKISITESSDWEMVWQISQHPAVVEAVTNDEWHAEPPSVRRAQCKLFVEKPGNHLLLVRDEEADGIICGCFVLDQVEPGVHEVHTMLLPSCRGAHGIAAGRLGIKYAMSLPGVEKLISCCPMQHKEILFFALKCGFHRVGESAMFWIKAGVVYPIQIVELTRKDFEPCH